jgi:hypothetical protein
VAGGVAAGTSLTIFGLISGGAAGVSIGGNVEVVTAGAAEGCAGATGKG